MFTKLILNRFPNVKRLVIFSRDEQKHFQMAQEFLKSVYYALNVFIEPSSIIFKMVDGFVFEVSSFNLTM
ncbi:hypothetical protein [Tenacibaculum maritimum]|uniref:hypothetical protein n=1 Tax=Tenacibaculum maritimum TaxID=107401 RepID=UPI00388FF22E